MLRGGHQKLNGTKKKKAKGVNKQVHTITFSINLNSHELGQKKSRGNTEISQLRVHTIWILSIKEKRPRQNKSLPLEMKNVPSKWGGSLRLTGFIDRK